MRILLADNHKLFLDGLKVLLEKENGIKVAGEAVNGRIALKLAEKLLPDLVIMDVSMPELNGIEATRQIRAAKPGIKVLAVSMHNDRQFVAGMLSAGASGYVLKDCASDELISAIKTITRGGRYLSPSIMGIVVDDYVNMLSPSGTTAVGKLSTREKEVLQLLAEGHSISKIASKLFLSKKTVETHKTNMMNKTGIYTLAELTKFAIREGLTTLDGGPNTKE